MVEELTYKEAGVDIDAGNALVKSIKKSIAQTPQAGVLGGIGGFGGCFELPVNQYKAPVLVSATDGVGTKLRLAIDSGQVDGVGIDLVAMCVNDILVQGATPLFFLDYFATGQLDVALASRVIEGICEGCKQAACALIGGETAEMPNMYSKSDFDLAGFSVGIAEKSDLLGPHRVQDGDVILGLASNGFHSNGYSLIRKALERHDINPQTTDFEGTPLIDHLLRPTRIYVPSVLALMKTCTLNAAAHITGGGLYENIPRVLPKELMAQIRADAWPKPKLMQWIQDLAQMDDKSLYTTFNGGIGMILILAPSHVENAIMSLEAHGETVFQLGHIVSKSVASTDDAIEWVSR